MSSPAYRTKQRDRIWRYLCEHKASHIVADDIVEHLRLQGESVGKSTVYRYLDRLVSEGLVRKFFLEGGKSACYQLASGSEACKEHFHLICVDCGRLIHLECDYLCEIQAHIRESHGFRIDNTKTVFYGLCETCAQKKNPLGGN